MNNSQRLFQEAKKVMPGGVSSPVRAYQAVGGEPPFIRFGCGSHIFDVDGNDYIDYVLSWGPLVLGHSDPDVVRAVKEAASNGMSFGAPCELETKLAGLIIEMVPSVEMVRFVNSGTEAVMSAIRLARGFTGRDKIVKFDGAYHGHCDSLLVKAGSGSMTLGLPSSSGVPYDLVKNTISLGFNDPDAVRCAFEQNRGKIACVIAEPVCGNMGVVLPKKGYLEGLRRLCTKHGALLIFDEVMTGFRVSLGGAQKEFGIMPDLTCLGKVIGGGLPVGAYGGRKEIMQKIAPAGDIYQAGTLSGNPLAMTAGIVTLQKLRDTDSFVKAKRACEMLSVGIAGHLKALKLPWKAVSIGSMFSLFFTEGSVDNYQNIQKCDTEIFSKYFNLLLKEGIYTAPSQFEAGFTSTAHTENDIDNTLEVCRRALSAINK